MSDYSKNNVAFKMSSTADMLADVSSWIQFLRFFSGQHLNLNMRNADPKSRHEPSLADEDDSSGCLDLGRPVFDPQATFLVKPVPTSRS